MLFTLLVGLSIFWCIKRRLDARANEDETVIKVAPFRPTNVNQIQYEPYAEQVHRVDSEQSIVAGDSSAMPFVSDNMAENNLTVQPTIVDYEKEKRYTTEENKDRMEESTIEPLPVGQHEIHENTFAEELANALEL